MPKTMKSITMMTSAEIAQHRALLGKVYVVSVQTRAGQGGVHDIEEFSPERAWETVGQTFRRFPRIVGHGWRELNQEIV